MDKQDCAEGVIVECLTMYATLIAGVLIQPGTVPSFFTQETYNLYKDVFDFYEKERVIRVIPQGGREFSRKLDIIKLAQEKAEQDVPRGQVPLKPYAVDLRQREPERFENAIVVKSAKDIVDGEDKDTICIATTKTGDRCTKERATMFKVCDVHLRAIKAGRNVTTPLGEPLTLELVSLG